MKKIMSVLVAALCLFVCSGCQPKEESGSAVREPGAASQSRKAEEEHEEEKVELCINYDFEDSAKEVIRYLKDTGHETEFRLLVLPKDAVRREAKIAELRTEIMAGGGPDAFILPAPNPNWAEPEPQLFTNPEKSMYSNVFLALDKFVEGSQYVNLLNCNPVVMDAGVTEKGRFLLPLRYTYTVAVLEGGNYQDSEFSSWDELANCEESAVRSAFGSIMITSFFNTFSQIADYSAENLTVSEEELEAHLRQAKGLWESLTEDRPALLGFMDIAILGGLQSAETEQVLIPLNNSTGGITANIPVFAAINRNTKHPDGAFSFVELLLSDELQKNAGFFLEETGQFYCSTFSFGDVYALPVKDALLPEFSANLVGRLDEKLESDLQDISSRINYAGFYSDLDKDILELYSECQYAQEEQIAGIVDEACTTLRMKLAE